MEGIARVEAAEIRKVLLRGGSIASGYGVEQGYADILKSYCASRGIELINRSRFQDNSFDGIWTFSEDIEPYAPQLLLVHFGVDDAFFPVYRSEFKENLVRMVQRARELFSPEICLLTSHTFADPYEMDAVNIFYRVIREVATDLHCVMIPIHTCWAGHLFDTDTANADLVLKDARYPNGEGHKIIAEAVIRRLEHLLTKAG